MPAFIVNIGNYSLTLADKIGYNLCMFAGAVYFVLRICLLAVVWAFVWQYVPPKTQLLRVLRAALLVLGMIGVMTLLRITGS